MHDQSRKTPEIKPDLCVIGLEPAGLEVAFGAAALGVPVALVTQRAAPPERLPGMADPVRRVAALGARIIEGEGRFVAPNMVATDALRLRARRFVIATGAEQARPAIAGLADVPTLHPSAAAGAHLLVFGAGAEGVAAAQHGRRAGARVTLLVDGGFLPDFDPDGAAILQSVLEREGVTIRQPVDLGTASLIAAEEGQYRLAFKDGSGPVTFTHAAFDCGMIPAIAGLALDHAGIRLRDGVPVVDAAMRATNRRVYVAGGVSGLAAPADRAGVEAAAILKEVLFRTSGAIDPALVPRRVATMPALAEFGLSDGRIPSGERARLRFLRVPLAREAGDLPSAAGHAHAAGYIKVITTPKGVVRGASILAPDASALLSTLMLATAQGIPIHALADLPLSSGTTPSAIRALGALALRDRLRSPGTTRLIRFLRWLG